MKALWIGGCLLGLAIQPSPWTQDSRLDPVSMDSELWERSSAQGELLEHLGRQAYLMRAGMLWLSEADLQEGTIEFDIAFGGERGFVGAAFHIQDRSNYEHVYLRPHQSGQPDACQYTPVINGLSAWQLYGSSSAAIHYEPERWTRVRIDFWGAGVYLAVDSNEPQMVAQIRGNEQDMSQSNGVGLTVAGGFAPAYFSNFRYGPLETAPSAAVNGKGDALPGVVASWSVSSAIPESSVNQVLELPADLLDDLEWLSIEADPSGITNLAKRQGIAGGKNTCFARLALPSDQQQLKRFALGFSDTSRVYLNRRLIFTGKDGYRTRDHRFLGSIGLFDELVLSLQPGENELLIAVSEGFGGWGLMGQFPGD